MQRTLSHAETLSIFADESADYFPFRVINESGKVEVDGFINRCAADPERHNRDAWYSSAEQAANNALPGEAIIIEMRGMHTSTGNPATVKLEPEHFDWMINN